MKELTIVKGEEFRVVVKDEIKSEDIFIEEYREAARKLSDVVLAARKVMDRSREAASAFGRGFQEDMIDCYENNIIAFCGERGEGKSSAMMTFINEVQNNRSNSVLPFAEEAALTYFAPPLIIDPSLFDGIHNVLDIVLAKEFPNPLTGNT